MTWFRLDDGWLRHPKMRAAGLHGRALWLAGCTYCAEQLTDGAIPKAMLPLLAAEAEAKPAAHKTLIEVGLWEDAGSEWVVHDWLKYQPSRADVEAERAKRHEAKAKAGRSGGVASGVARRKHKRSSNEAEPQAEHEAQSKQNEAPSRPVLLSDLHLHNGLDSPVDNPGDGWVNIEVNRRLAIHPSRSEPGTPGYKSYRASIEASVRAEGKPVPPGPVNRDEEFQSMASSIAESLAGFTTEPA